MPGEGMSAYMNSDILEDLLRPGLKLVICGTAAGKRSAELKSYYAGPGNKFWRIMHEIGLTPERLAPLDWREIGRYGIGFTDMAKAHFGSDADLPAHAFDAARLRGVIAQFRPVALAFNGKKAAQMFYGRTAIDYGPQPAIDQTAIWVLPSTSGAASGAWSPLPWRQMAESLRLHTRSNASDFTAGL